MQSNFKQKCLKRCVEIAHSHKGLCISKEFISFKSPISWKCERRHRFEESLAKMKNRKSFCNICAIGKIKTIKDIQTIAKSRNVKLLDSKIQSHDFKYEWQCENGHVWKGTYLRISRTVNPCQICGGRKIASTSLCSKIAREKGGRVLTKFVHRLKPMGFECAKKHTWLTKAKHVLEGMWCPKCANENNNRKNTIENMKLMAKEKNGHCLSDIYINCSEKLQWKCSIKHTWFATPTSIQSGTWCPKCAVIRVAKFNTIK